MWADQIVRVFSFTRLAVWAWCHLIRSSSYMALRLWVVVRIWLRCVHRTCWRMSGVLVVRVGRLRALASNYKFVNLFQCCFKSAQLVGHSVRFPVLPTSYGIIFVTLSLSSFVTFGLQGGHGSDTCVPNMPRRYVVAVMVLGRLLVLSDSEYYVGEGVSGLRTLETVP